LSEKDKFTLFNYLYVRKKAISKYLVQPENIEEFVDVNEASMELGVSPRTLTEWCQSGKVYGARKLNNKWHATKMFVDETIRQRKKYMSISEFCKKMGLSWKVVNTRIKNNHIPDFKKIDNHWYIPIDAVQKYEENLDWLKRKAPAPERDMSYYSKDSMLTELKNKIVEIKPSHLKTVTHLYIRYCEERIGKTNSKGYRMKSLCTDLFNVFLKFISPLSKDIVEDNEGDIHELLSKSDAAYRLKIQFRTFLNFAYAQLDINPKLEFKITRTKNRDDDDNEPYSPELYHSINQYARDTETHIPNALRASSYVHMWVYVLLHLTDVWRHQDIIEKMPNIPLELIGVTSHKWFKENKLSNEQAQAIINHLYIKLRPEVTNKTRAYLTFLVEPSLIETLSTALVISELHRRRNSKEKLLYTFINRTGEIVITQKGHYAFFNDKPELKVFRNRKMNRSVMTYFYYHITEDGGDHADVTMDTNKIVRSHKDPKSTEIYIKTMNKDGSVNRVSETLFKRGHFGWLYNYMIVMALEGRDVNQSIEERTATIQKLRNDASPKELEEWADFFNLYRLKQQSIITDLAKLPKEELIELIGKIFRGEMPAKTNPGQCLISPNCKYANKNNCFGCEYFIPQFYVLIEAANEFRRLTKSMQEARHETTFIRDKAFLKTILVIIQEAKNIYNSDQVNSFIPPLEIKHSLESLRSKTFLQ
jgi:hypothetical protein